MNNKLTEYPIAFVSVHSGQSIDNEENINNDFSKLIIYLLLFPYIYEMPVPVAARSKAWVCGRSPAKIVRLSPARRHGYLL